MPDPAPPTLDPVALARWHRAAPLESPWLHEEVARRMRERLAWIKRKPQQWTDWEPVRGGMQAHDALLQDCGERCVVLERLPHRQQAARQRWQPSWWQPRRWRKDAATLQPAPASQDMVWANMALHLEAQPQALIARWHQLLKVDGFVMFSCLGPDSALELRQLYQALGWPAAGHELTDMHDWGDMLVHCGFAEPVMDMERLTLTFESPERLLQELASLGRNFHPLRFPALRGRHWKAHLLAAMLELMPRQPDGRWPLSFELIYGHAMKPAPRVKLEATSQVSLDDMRRMLKAADPSSGA